MENKNKSKESFSKKQSKSNSDKSNSEMDLMSRLDIILADFSNNSGKISKKQTTELYEFAKQLKGFKKYFSNNLPKLNVSAAGIDIGSKAHFVAVPEDRSETPVRSFEAFTPDLYELAKWLKECGIDKIVMESTGVYWIAPFRILEDAGFEVILVNARHVKNVPGRKTDVKDSQWLQTLHTYGLLSGSFQPDNEIRALRTYVRQKASLTRSASSHIQRMQKILTQMNVLLHNVISDITGKSGMAILRAIVDGERDPDALVLHCDSRLKNPIPVIKKSLVGDYREEYIFLLKQELEFYEYYQKKLEECDVQIKKLLSTFEECETLEEREDGEKPKKNKKKNTDPVLQKEIIRITGTDLSRIDGLNTASVLTLLSETGINVGEDWETEKHFGSWLGLAPNSKITGGKLLSSRTKKVQSRAAYTFRIAALSVSKSDCYLGAFYRKKCAQKGAPIAITATAYKIAKIYYFMLKNGTEYYDHGAEYYDKKYKERTIKYLKSRVKDFGFELTPTQTG